MLGLGGLYTVQIEICLFKRGTFIAITSKLGGVGIEMHGKSSLIAIKTPPPRDSLSSRKIVNLRGRISLS